jgi:hypothetical protein
LDALGFNAADAAAATGASQRNLEATQSRIKLSGEDEREQLNASSETRGVLSSGEHQTKMAKQRANEASNLSLAETEAADRVASINRELQRAQAQRQLQMEQQNAERTIADQQYSLQQQLLAQSAQSQVMPAPFDITALYPQIPGGPVTGPTPATPQSIDAWRRVNRWI